MNHFAKTEFVKVFEPHFNYNSFLCLLQTSHSVRDSTKMHANFNTDKYVWNNCEWKTFFKKALKLIFDFLLFVIGLKCLLCITANDFLLFSCVLNGPVSPCAYTK